MKLSFQNWFFVLATGFAVFALLIFAKIIIVPIALALLLSFILLPVARKFEVWGVNRILSAILSILIMFMLLGVVILFFVFQITNIETELTDFQEKLAGVLSQVILFLNNNLSLNEDLKSEDVIIKVRDWLKETAVPVVGSSLNGLASFFAGFLATVIYTFLLLIYRTGLVNAVVKFAEHQNRIKMRNLLHRIQKVGKEYLGGLLTLMFILGCVNSLGLWIIGVDSPLLFGFLAAVMSIVPFIGTTAGASIAVLYAFMTNDSLTVPLTVVAMFWSIQIIESNFLNPKVVGSGLKLNAFASILTLFVGAAVWGVAGMILFLPFIAMFKVVCEEVTPLQPVSLLLSSNIYDGKEKKKLSLSALRNKIKSWFSKKNHGGVKK